MIKTIGFSLATLAVLCFSPLSHASDAEVMTVSGTASAESGGTTRPLAQGDLVRAGDRIDVPAGSHLDLAYDKDWKNATRFTGPTQVEIVSVHPTGLHMKRGDVFAHLKRLPKDSTFEIQTPSAVAAVRGSALRTTHDDEKGTNVYNFSDSPVEVFGVGADGAITGSPEILDKFEKSAIGEDGPTPPSPMSEDEKNAGAGMQTGLQEEIAEAAGSGRESALEPIDKIEQDYRAALDERLIDAAPTGDIAARDAALPEIDKALAETSASVEKIESGKDRQDQKVPEEKPEDGGQATESGTQRQIVFQGG